MKSSNVIYNDDVNYDVLEQHTYSDSPGEVFYTCPVCGNEYLATFIFEEDGVVKCIDCCSE